MIRNPVDGERLCLPNLPRIIDYERPSHIASKQYYFSQNQSFTAPTCAEPSCSQAFPDAAAAAITPALFTPNRSSARTAPSHSADMSSKVHRHRTQPSANSPGHSPVMFSRTFSKTSEGSWWTDGFPTANTRVRNMQNFLESEQIRGIEGTQSEEGNGPHKARDRSELLEGTINFNDFSALLHDNSEWSSETEPDATSIAGSTTYDTSGMHSKFALKRRDSATADLDLDQATSGLGYVSLEKYQSYGDIPGTIQSPAIRRVSLGDSGFAEAQESPFMGSPETQFDTDWLRMGRVDSRDALASPRTLVSTRIEEMQTSYTPLADFQLFDSNPNTAPTYPCKITSTGYQLIMAVVLLPIMQMNDMQEFRPALEQTVTKLQEGSIPCLRDLEKVLLFELGHQSKECTAASYMMLCYKFLINSSRLWPQLCEDDLCGPNEPPYNRSYFLDVWHKVMGTAQMRFRIHRDELEKLWKNTYRTMARNTRDPSKGGGVPPSAGTATLLKRQLSTDGGSRKRPRTCSSRPKESQDQSSASAAAAAFNHTTGTNSMQPPLPSGQDVGSASCTTPQPQVLSTNALAHHPRNYLDAGAPYETHTINPPFNGSTFTYDDITGTATSEMEYRQIQHRAPMVSRAMQSCGGSTQIGFVPHSSPDSPSTVAQSDASSSPGSSFKRKKDTKSTDEVHICELCPKEFPRACDLKKHRKTHDRPYKCSVAACNYYTLGFSAEKDRDRHFHDKHDKDTPKKMCHYDCGYSSPRLSNVKQHMEKAHGYEYIRTKTVQRTGKHLGGISSKAKRSQKRVRRTSYNLLQPPSVASSVDGTPMVPSTGCGSSNSSPSFGPDTFSPATLGEPSPAMDPADLFPPLPSHRSPGLIAPEVIYQPPDAQQQTPGEELEPFRSPSSALQAMSRRCGMFEDMFSPMHAMSELNGMRETATMDTTLGGESPSSDYADYFLRDAPPAVMNQFEQYPIDPRLPVVTNTLYNEEKDPYVE